MVGNSSLIYYYVSLFWCSTIYLTDRILQKENIGLRQILLMGFNIVFAVIINSRSWIIQSCLVAVVIYLFGTTQRNIRTKVLRLLLLLLGGYIILQLLNNYFSMNLIFLSDKLGRDRQHLLFWDGCLETARAQCIMTQHKVIFPILIINMSLLHFTMV